MLPFSSKSFNKYFLYISSSMSFQDFYELFYVSLTEAKRSITFNPGLPIEKYINMVDSIHIEALKQQNN